MRIWAAFPLLLCMCLSGCIGATRLPERTHGQQGPIDKIDLSFLKAGETSRAEVLEKLKPINTGVESERFFIGRWDTSKWGAWVVLAGNNSAFGNAGRVWRDQNLLIEFDEHGIVKSYEIFPDKLFETKIDPVVHEARFSEKGPLDVQVSFAARYFQPANLTLSTEALEFTETRQVKKPFHFRVPRIWLTTTRPFLGSSEDAVLVVARLSFSKNLKPIGGPHGKSLNVQSTIPQLITLLRYTAQPDQSQAIHLRSEGGNQTG